MEVFRSSHTHMNDAAAMLMISAGTAIHVDGDTLTRLMIEYNIGVSPVQTYTIKQLNSDFFSLMTNRKNAAPARTRKGLPYSSALS